MSLPNVLPQGGSEVLAQRLPFPHVPFGRYADDAICHCRTETEARALW
jgi:hypothetical protein